MSGQNRFLLPPSLASKQQNDQLINQQTNSQSSCSVDADFDSYWDEEARNPFRNRIRIGRQYQATVPPLLKPGEKDRRKLDDLETLRFCPNKSADLTNDELEHYFNVAKSINLFASLVETRCLLGKDVTIADLNHIKNKEGLSLASVIQPTPLISLKPSQYNGQSATNSDSNSLHQLFNNNSPSNHTNHGTNLTPSSASHTNNKNSSPPHQYTSTRSFSSVNLNVNPFIKALSHFISLHHPGHQESGCKKNQIEISLAVDDNTNTTSLGTLRPASTSSNILLLKETKVSRSRASKQATLSREAIDTKNTEESPSNVPCQDWTREEIELFAKALEICGKNFGAIKKEFLPSKSVRSIVEYYYIGSREYLDSRRKTEACSSPEKQQTHNGQGGGGGGDGSTGSGGGGGSTSSGSNNSTTNVITDSTSNNTSNKTNNNADDQRGKTKSASCIKIETLDCNLATSKLTIKDEFPSDKLDIKVLETQEDSRMSVYTFEDDMANIGTKQSMPLSKSSPGAEVRPLKAKPILPYSSLDADPNLSNVGSLKFYMEGQLVLKLNARQDQTEGVEKCHWVQSESCNSNKMMRLSKKRLKKHDHQQSNIFRHTPTDQQNSNCGMSYQDEDFKNDTTSGDESSKGSADSMISQEHSQPSIDNVYPSKKPKIEQATPLNYHDQPVSLPTALQSPTLNPNYIHQPWSSQALAAAAYFLKSVGTE